MGPGISDAEEVLRLRGSGRVQACHRMCELDLSCSWIEARESRSVYAKRDPMFVRLCSIARSKFSGGRSMNLVSRREIVTTSNISGSRAPRAANAATYVVLRAHSDGESLGICEECGAGERVHSLGAAFIACAFTWKLPMRRLEEEEPCIAMGRCPMDSVGPSRSSCVPDDRARVAPIASFIARKTP